MRRWERTHISNPPLATRAILIAALPALLSEWAILPPSSLDAARVWKVLHFDGRVGDDRDDPYSTAILVLVPEPGLQGAGTKEKARPERVWRLRREVERRNVQSLSEVG